MEDVGAVPSVVLLDRTHGYQDDVNLTHVWDGVNAANDQTFWYTANNRLQNASGAYGALTFYYDANGNRTHRIVDQGGGSVETKVFSYPSTSNLIFDVETNSTVTRTFAHDAAGNMSADTRGGVAYQYGYNANNRLETVSTGGLLKGQYVYNAFEQLVSRTRVNMSPAGTIHLIHDRDGNVIAETDGAGNTVREYVWLQEAGSAAGATGTNGIPLPLAVISAVNTATPVTYFVHADHLNRPVAMTGATKQVVWSASYLPFGGEYQITGPASLDARFPGQWFQMESGLAYNWHRHYDASLGRYTQPDPLGFIDGPSRYAYAVNSPQMYVDEDGQSSRGVPVPWLIPPVMVPGTPENQKMAEDTERFLQHWFDRFANRSSRGKWQCTASCNVQPIGNNWCPIARVFGQGSGPSEEAACRAAKRNATQSAPAGTYARHCQCRCQKR